LPAPISTATATPTETAVPTVARIATATRPPVPNVTRAATRTIAQHFLVGRPVAPSATMIVPDPIYLYGTTRRGDLDVHHGEEFENPTGTPLYAVADGTIVVAGGDDQPICGDDGFTLCGRPVDSGGYYGKLVVLQLSKTFIGRRVFALYGHMNSFAVKSGDLVKSGDPIGTIGSTGVALGPHVHFEIRLDVNDYAHTRNAILWMTPLAGRGSLAGRYSDAGGSPIRGALINFYRVNGDFLFATETYSRDRWPEVNSDDEIGENFAAGDLPVGDYIIRVQGQQFAQRVTIQDGKLSFVDLGIPQ
jgi:murein DD-endopeptidase MepM/ murein hydrolase activator NlpD